MLEFSLMALMSVSGVPQRPNPELSTVLPDLIALTASAGVVTLESTPNSAPPPACVASRRTESGCRGTRLLVEGPTLTERRMTERNILLARGRMRGGYDVRMRRKPILRAGTPWGEKKGSPSEVGQSGEAERSADLSFSASSARGATFRQAHSAATSVPSVQIGEPCTQ